MNTLLLFHKHAEDGIAKYSLSNYVYEQMVLIVLFFSLLRSARALRPVSYPLVPDWGGLASRDSVHACVFVPVYNRVYVHIYVRVKGECIYLALAS